MAHTCNNHDFCIDKALLQAEAACIIKKARLTPTRKRVLELIWSSHKAHKAYDILEVLSKEDSSAKPPTVYRALDFLLEMGLIHKIESLNAYVGCPHPEDDSTHQFLICEKCGNVDEIYDAEINKKLNALCLKNHFKQNNKVIEIKGLCKNCI